MSLPEELQGRSGDVLVAGIAAPIFLAVVYGIYEFVASGWSSEFYMYTYVPVFGGIASIAGLMAYYLRVVSPTSTKISWKTLPPVLAFPPCLFLIYVIGFLGLYAIYQGAIVSFSIWTVLNGICWIAIGYRAVSQLYLMTNIVKRSTKPHPPIP
jgi:hypothetical protein